MEVLSGDHLTLFFLIGGEIRMSCLSKWSLGVYLNSIVWEEVECCYSLVEVFDQFGGYFGGVLVWAANYRSLEVVFVNTHDEVPSVWHKICLRCYTEVLLWFQW